MFETLRTKKKRAAQAEGEPRTTSYAPFFENPGWDCCIVPFPCLYDSEGRTKHSSDDKERNNPSYTGSASQT